MALCKCARLCPCSCCEDKKNECSISFSTTGTNDLHVYWILHWMYNSVSNNFFLLRSRFVEQNDEKYQTYNTIPLYEVAKIADRYKVSNWIAPLVDYKVRRPNATRSAIDWNKVARYRKFCEKRKLKINFLVKSVAFILKVKVMRWLYAVRTIKERIRFVQEVVLYWSQRSWIEGCFRPLSIQ